MLFILGIGSIIAPITGIMCVIQVNFEFIKTWQAALIVSCYGLFSGSVYYTQSGQDILDLVDDYGVTFVIFNLSIFEIVTFCYIYGVSRVVNNIKFMLGFTPGIYLRICWKYLTPIFLVTLLLYGYVNNISDNSSQFPFEARVFGFSLSVLALIHLPLIMIYECFESKGSNWIEKIKTAFSPKENWGPARNSEFFILYQQENLL
jgi:hypothetical protein